MKDDEFSGLVIYGKKGAQFSNGEVELIAENIKRILTTKKGERVNNPEFGSRVMEYIFMPQMYCSDLIAEIISSVQEQEPRVTVNNCKLSSIDDNETIHITLDITLNTENKQDLTIGVTL